MALVCVSLSRLWTGISCKYDWWSAICLFKPSAVHERSPNVTATVDIFPSVAKPPCPAQAQCSTKWIGLKWRSQESNRKPLKTLDFWVSLSNQVSAPDMCSLVASKAVGASKLEKQWRWYLITLTRIKNYSNQRAPWNGTVFQSSVAFLPLSPLVRPNFKQCLFEIKGNSETSWLTDWLKKTLLVAQLGRRRHSSNLGNLNSDSSIAFESAPATASATSPQAKTVRLPEECGTKMAIQTTRRRWCNQPTCP